VTDPSSDNLPATCSSGFTRERQVAFLRALATCGNVRAACAAAGVSHQTVYRARRSGSEFRLGWDAALVTARGLVEEVLADRALNGVEEAVYYHGEEVARRVRFDSRLLLAHLGRLDRLEADVEVVEVADDFEGALRRFARRGPLHVIPGQEWRHEDPDDPALPEFE